MSTSSFYLSEASSCSISRFTSARPVSPVNADGAYSIPNAQSGNVSIRVTARSIATSGLTYTVKPGEQTFDIPLTR